MKPRILVLILVLAVAAVSVGAALAYHQSVGGTIACITQDGTVITRIDLSAVEETYSFTISCDEGENTVEVKPGAIRISHATCRDQICVSNGWSSTASLPIVCLPHRLVISFESEAPAEIDGVSGR